MFVLPLPPRARAARYACHELRNPLHAILALLNLMLHDREPPVTGSLRDDIRAVQLSAASMQVCARDGGTGPCV